MEHKMRISRREFLKVSSVMGAGLMVSIYLSSCKDQSISPTLVSIETLPPDFTPDPDSIFKPGPFLQIDGDGSITVVVSKPEVGQGIRTTIAMLIAEELDVELSSIKVIQAESNSVYGEQIVGGSQSIQHVYTPLRYAGAVARKMLLTAAAEIWEIDPTSCSTRAGKVVHPEYGWELSYGDLAGKAATLAVPDRNNVQLKKPEEYIVIGQNQDNIDNHNFVTGKAVFGMDVTLPNMLYAVIARTPIMGGNLRSFDSRQSLNVPGVVDVLEVSRGVAVVAKNTWAAIQGREALEIDWETGSNLEVQNLDNVTVKTLERSQSHLSDGSETNLVEAIYKVPYLAHMTMEPMNCTAIVGPDRCDVWAPTQDPGAAKRDAVKASGMSRDLVNLKVPFIGGGFGRRLNTDYVPEAIEVSKKIGVPVKVVWTREDDLRHDHFHPLSTHYVSARKDKLAMPIIKSTESNARYMQTGYWRSVENFTEGFVRECFIDEFANEIGMDPVELRLEIYPDQDLKDILSLASEKAEWGKVLPEGWGRGVAAYSTWGRTPVAQIAEVFVDSKGIVHVHRVVCAINCGQVVNPHLVEAQMEGGIVFALGAALKSSISFKEGRIQESNFHDYPILKFDEMPKIEVHILKSDSNPVGVGEMGVPPAAPAILNAVFDATGIRIRHLPVKPEDLI